MSDKRLSIMHVIARLNVGGAALHVLQLAREQERRGHQVLVVAGTLAEGEESMEYVADELGVGVLKLPALQRAALRPRGHVGDPPAARADQGAAAGRAPHAYREGGSDRAPRGARRGPGATARGRPHVPRSRPQRLLQPPLGAGLPPDRRRCSRTRRERSSPSATRSATTSSASASPPQSASPSSRTGSTCPEWGPPTRPHAFASAGELGLADDTLAIGWAGRLTAIKRPLDLVRTLRAGSGRRRRRRARARRRRRGPAGGGGPRARARRRRALPASSASRSGSASGMRPWTWRS